MYPDSLYARKPDIMLPFKYAWAWLRYLAACGFVIFMFLAAGFVLLGILSSPFWLTAASGNPWCLLAIIVIIPAAQGWVGVVVHVIKKGVKYIERYYDSFPNSSPRWYR